MRWSDVICWKSRDASGVTKTILKEFHQEHPGIGRMKALMRSYTYWPNMDKDIKTCKGCQLAAKAPPVKFTPWPKTDVPWTRLHVDYAGPMNGNYYLIVVDSYSQWPEIFKCKRPTATVTKYFLTELFACFGVCEKLSVTMGPNSQKWI